MVSLPALNLSEARVCRWQPSSWDDFSKLRDRLEDTERVKLFFHQGRLLVTDMGWEGIDHASISDLFTMIFFIWSLLHPEQTVSSLGRCLLEQPGQGAASPDLVLYLGENYPRWQAGQPRQVDLTQWSSPALVGEISDTTLPTDLDEKKQLYALLGVLEYWVIDVKGRRVFAFQRQDSGRYQEIAASAVLAGLPIALLEQTLNRLTEESNTQAAAWFRSVLAQPQME
ncbi:MAG TPA: Uma2 family endonuclease [Leptolyngbyaceae cyanobacterium]